MQSVLHLPVPIFVLLHERFKCVVCHTVLKDPWQTQCGHRMCFTCMNEMFLNDSEVMCPANEEDCEIISRDRVSTRLANKCVPLHYSMKL